MFFFSPKTTVVTHDGGFHADDVFAVATLSILFAGRIRIIRTRDPKKISEADYVVDVGNIYNPKNNRFDHHQPGGGGQRANGISYAAFGLVWKTYGEKISGGKTTTEIIERRLVSPIDAHDNGEGELAESLPGVFPYTINEIIDVLNPTNDEINANSRITNGTFLKAVAMAKELLIREIKWVRARLEAEEILRKSFIEAKDKRIIVVQRLVPVEEYFSSYPEPLFIVYQYSDGDFAVRAVRQAPHLFESRKLFPEDWAGKRNGELVAVTGVPDAVFCHNKRFLAIAKSKEGALKLAELALS